MKKLIDLVEIHFIELPKFRKLENKNYKNEALQRWLTFLEKDVSREVLEELMQMEPTIKMAEKKLGYLSSDPETLELYKAREYSNHERANMISSADIDIDIIMASTELTRKQIEMIKKESLIVK